jgi:hypothetical protein
MATDTINANESAIIEWEKVVIESCFGQDTITSIIDFGKKIIAEKADLIILMARKAVFFYDILQKIGLDFQNTEVVSNRILDFDDKFFKDKKIVIVDDSPILGTTAKKIIGELQEKATKEVKFFTFAADKNYLISDFSPDYIQRIYGESRDSKDNDRISSSNHLLNFCYNEVKAISSLSLPYLIDFPVSQNISLSRQEFTDAYQTLKEFMFVKELPVHSDYSDVHAFSCYPNQNLKKQFITEIGENFYNNFIHCEKIRLYVQELSETNLRIKLVPLFLFKPFTNENTKIIFDKIIGDNHNQCFDVLNSNKAHYRFVQYYLSYSLGKYYLELCNLSHLFPSCDEKVKNITFSKKISDEIKRIRFKPSLLKELNFEFETFEYEDDFQDILSKIDLTKCTLEESFSEIFTNLFNVRERAARNLDKNYENRLQHGINLGQISEFYNSSTYFSESDTNPLSKVEQLSNFLDICNDAGISVPIICETKAKNGCYRAYRHGELALLTDTNKALLFYYLCEFFKDIDNTNEFIPHKLLEKISVLFFRLGVKKEKKFIKRYEEESIDDRNRLKFISIGWDLHGAILTTETKERRPQSKRNWFFYNDTTRPPYIIKEKTEDKDTDKFDVDKFKLDKTYVFRDIAENNNEKNKARSIGVRLKTIYRLDKENFDDIITILASCPDIESFVFALLAETNKFNEQYQSVFTEIINKHNDYQELYSILKSNKILNTTIHQALFKYSRGTDINSFCQDILSRNEYDPDTEMFIDGFKRSNKDSKYTHILQQLKNIIFKFADIGNELIFLRIYFKAILLLEKKISHNSIFTLQNLVNNQKYVCSIVSKTKDKCTVIAEKFGYNNIVEISSKTATALFLQDKTMGSYEQKITINNEQLEKFAISKIDNIDILSEEYFSAFVKYNNDWQQQFGKGLYNRQLFDDKLKNVIGLFRNDNIHQLQSEITQEISRIKSNIERAMSSLMNDVENLEKEKLLSHYLSSKTIYDDI